MSKRSKQNQLNNYNIRAIAVQYLVEMEQKKAYSTILFNQYVANYPLSKQDKALLTEIVYGTIQRQLTLDYYLRSFVKKVSKMQRWVYFLLLISLYQLLYLSKVPDHAVIFEAVEIAKKRGHQGVVKLVNGVLRSVQRKGVPNGEEIENDIQRFSIQYSIPIWLVDYLVTQFGRQEASQLAASLLETPYLSVRCNDDPANRTQLIELLRNEGVIAKASSIAPQGLRIIEGNIFQTALFANGHVTIQDESSMLVAETGHIQPNHHLLDCCSAPGGKTTHMAQWIDEKQGGKVTALDLYEHKIKLIKQNAERMKLDNRIETIQMDAREAGSFFEPASFNIVYVDAPCSGLGLMRRKPDLKYTKKLADLNELHQIQMDILTSVAPLVALNGELVYSTCTFTQEENQQTVAKFLATHPEFMLDPIKNDAVAKSILPDGTVQILPHHYGTDGFFISRFRKIR